MYVSSKNRDFDNSNFFFNRYAGVYDELLSPPRRTVEPPYGPRYDCNSLDRVFMRSLTTPKRIRSFVDVLKLLSGLNLCSPFSVQTCSKPDIAICILNCVSVS